MLRLTDDYTEYTLLSFGNILSILVVAQSYLLSIVTNAVFQQCLLLHNNITIINKENKEIIVSLYLSSYLLSKYHFKWFTRLSSSETFCMA